MGSVSALNSLTDESVVIVSNGFSSLSATCHLADAGADVTLLEKNKQFGDRASTLEHDGFQFDTGSSWYLMPDVSERFFTYFDKRPKDYYGLTRLNPHHRIFFEDNDHVDMLPDITANKVIFESYKLDADDGLDDYLREAERSCRIGMECFVYTDRPTLTDYTDLGVFRYSWGLSLVDSMQGHVENYFDHPRLQQVMQYTPVFLGDAPNNTPALYNLMGHVDFNVGVHYPDGGLAGTVGAIISLIRESGIEFHIDSPVAEIIDRRGGFVVRTECSREFLCDQVVSNAGYAHTGQELLPGKGHQCDTDYWGSRTYAPSAFLLYLGAEGDVNELAHHTLMSSTDRDDHFKTVFNDPAWSDDPAYYPCVSSKTGDSAVPEGHSSLLALIPVVTGLEDTPERHERYHDLVLGDIAENAGVDLRDRIVPEEPSCVNDFRERYNSTQDVALGLAHTLSQTALLRPLHGFGAINGLYFTGSSTTPGIDVPMCPIGGQPTAEEMAEGAR